MTGSDATEPPMEASGGQKESGNAAPIIALYEMLKRRARVEVLLLHDKRTRFVGDLRGFDEYMNLVLENTREVTKGKGQDLGRIVLKGDCIGSISAQ